MFRPFRLLTQGQGSQIELDVLINDPANNLNGGNVTISSISLSSSSNGGAGTADRDRSIESVPPNNNGKIRFYFLRSAIGECVYSYTIVSDTGGLAGHSTKNFIVQSENSNDGIHGSADKFDVFTDRSCFTQVPTTQC